MKHRLACTECQTLYAAGNTLSRFCSSACRQRAWRRARPGYQSAATKRYLSDPDHQRARSAYMAEFRTRPEAVEARRDQQRERHAANPGPNRRRARQTYERVRDFLRQERIKSGCVDCGTREGLLHFDHRPGTVKHFNPSRARSLRAAAAEIAKCDVRCARCHAARHEREKRCQRASS